MKSKLKSIVLLAALSLGGLTAQTYDYPFRNPDLPLDVRVQDIISRLTLEEKVQLMKHAPRLFPVWVFLLITGGTKRCMAWLVRRKR